MCLRNDGDINNIYIHENMSPKIKNTLQYGMQDHDVQEL